MVAYTGGIRELDNNKKKYRKERVTIAHRGNS